MVSWLGEVSNERDGAIIDLQKLDEILLIAATAASHIKRFSG
jgi:hypothetical protein